MAKDASKAAIVVGACRACGDGEHADCRGGKDGQECPCAMVGHSVSMEKERSLVLFSFGMNNHTFSVAIQKGEVIYSIAGERIPREDYEACVRLAFQLAALDTQQRMAGGVVPGTFFPGAGKR